MELELQEAVSRLMRILGNELCFSQGRNLPTLWCFEYNVAKLEGSLCHSTGIDQSSSVSSSTDWCLLDAFYRYKRET